MVTFDIELPNHYTEFLHRLEARGFSMTESVKSCVIFDLNSIDADIKNIQMTHDIDIRPELSDGELIFKSKAS